jgi:Fe-S cluster assembly iron-binding protein IscA
MADQRIQIGQVWRKVNTGETFLVTKLYSEALATIAVLRPTEAATESMIRVRVERQGTSQALPGYSMAQENEGA